MKVEATAMPSRPSKKKPIVAEEKKPAPAERKRVDVRAGGTGLRFIGPDQDGVPTYVTRGRPVGPLTDYGPDPARRRVRNYTHQEATRSGSSLGIVGSRYD